MTEPTQKQSARGQKFFASKKAAAALKHAILRRYVVPFTSRAGKSAKRVVIVDGYAGAGRYSDGSEGSPAIIANAARNPALAGRHIDAFFVEKNRETRKRLAAVVAEEAAPNMTPEILDGRIELRLPELLQRAAGVPLFIFLDPYGLGINFQSVVDIYQTRPAGLFAPATEVLLRFDAGAVRRLRGWLSPTAKPIAVRDAGLERLDQVVGGRWWRDGPTDVTNVAFLEWVMDGFLARLSRQIGGGGWTTAIRPRADLQPAYYLVFVTRRREGLIQFGEILSSANQEWRKSLAESAFYNEYSEDLIEEYGLRWEDWFTDSETELEEGWKIEIERNIKRLLSEKDSFSIPDEYGTVFAGVEGLARETHLRKLLEKLFKEKLTLSDQKGQLTRNKLVQRDPQHWMWSNVRLP